jgi:peptidoglycan/xylan/chitin deacetylase (PgdA/CDA1 family)
VLKLIFWLKGNLAEGLKPEGTHGDGVSVAPFLHDRPAAASISADFELNWAWRELPPVQRDEKGRLERSNFPYLMSLLERTRIPITWATVGHMFLDSCSRGADGRAHPEMPRPTLNGRWSGDWYVHDPCGSAAASPLWYAPDLIEQLLAGNVRHEIGSHSFSHIDFSDLHSTPELVEAEMRACIGAMAPFGVHPRSLVYPFNKMGHGHLDLLATLGIVAVRHRDSRIRLSYPERTPSGVYKLYETLNLRRARFYDYPRKAALFLKEAAKRRAAFHIWLHPSAALDVLRDVFRPIVEHMARLRDECILWTATMAELAAYCEARNAVKLRIRRIGDELTISLDAAAFDVRRYGQTDLTLVIPCSQPPRAAFVSENGLIRAIDTPPAQASGPAAVMATIPVGATSLRLAF